MTTKHHRPQPQIIYTIPYKDRLLGMVLIGVLLVFGVPFALALALHALVQLFHF